MTKQPSVTGKPKAALKAHLSASLRLLRWCGNLLFILGFGIFNYSFFTADYKLTPDLLEAKISDESKRQGLIESAESLYQETGSVFTFISRLDQAFEDFNEKQVQAFALSDSEIESLVELNAQTFDLSSIEEVFDDSESGRFKAGALRNYGSWLGGRSYSSADDLRKDLNLVAENIRKYAITGEKGFDRYQIADLKYTLARSASQGPVKQNPALFLFLTYGLCIIGAMMYILPKKQEGNPGIKNNGIFFNPMTNTGWLGILTGSYLIIFYVVLYFFPEYMTSWIIMVDPVSEFLKGSEAGEFFLYGFIYTLCILVMGVRMMIKYRHSKYHLIRTASVMFFQTAFAFLIPEILLRLNQPYFDFKNIWPLDYDFFFDNELNTLIESGGLGIFMLGWGIALILIAVPVFVYFFGKRWYCSWVCGCGGLAETLGDPYRQLSDNSLKAWKVERWMIHSVLVFAVVMTGGVLYTYWTGESQILGLSTYDVRSVYGAWIGAGFAGVVGTGFYPFMGNRVWCRFGCPLAAYLGFVQRFKSRFRITTNGDQCISCGNCSTYCEMGIDVRWYAQRGQNIVRSSCVGCGVCASVCPRGVLRLENGPEDGRFNEPKAFTITDKGVLVNA